MNLITYWQATVFLVRRIPPHLPLSEIQSCYPLFMLTIRNLLVVAVLGMVAAIPSIRVSEACINRAAPLSFKADTPERKALLTLIKAKKWKQVVEAVQANLKRIRPMHEGWSRNAWWHYQGALAYLQLGKLEHAHAYILKIVRVPESKFRKTPRKYRAQIRFLYGNILLERNKLEHAIIQFTKAAGLNRRDASIHATLGTAYERAGNLKAAEKSLAKAVKLSPKHHGGMEWAHLELVRFKLQLKADPESYKTKPFLYKYVGKKSDKELQRARAFASKLAPDLPLGAPGG